MIFIVLWLPVVVGFTSMVTSPTRRCLVERRGSIGGLSVEELESLEWGVCVEETNAFRAGGPRLNAVNQDYGIETYDVTLKKDLGLPLGLELTELMANGDVGVVVVSGLTPDSPASNSNIEPGDVIAAVGETPTETMIYDRLVEVLVAAGDTPQLKMKRLVLRPKVEVEITYARNEYPDETHVLFAGENLRRAMLNRGVRLNDEFARRFDSQTNSGDCGGEGTCCTCAVDVLKGGDVLNPQKPQERQMLQPTPSWRLACKATVGDPDSMKPGDIAKLKIQVNPNQSLL